MKFMSHAIARKNTSKQSKSTRCSAGICYASRRLTTPLAMIHPTRMDGVHTGANQSVIHCGDTKFVFRYARFPTTKSRECHVSVVWKAVLLWITSVTDSIILQDTCCTRTYSFQMCAVSPKEKDICVLG